MSVAPHAGVVDFGTFTPPTPSLDGIQGEVPQPLIGQENYVLTGNGWSSLGALGALTYQGTWDASTNTPTLVSSVGVQGYYYVVSVAGNTDLNGTTTWDVGDWAIFNGSAWQKLEGGTVGTFTNVITPQVTAPTDNLTLSAISTGAVKFNTLGGLQAQVTNTTGANRYTQITGGVSGVSAPGVGVAGGNEAFDIFSSANVIRFYTNGKSNELQFNIGRTASAVNYVQVTGGTTGASSLASRPRIQALGSDATVGLTIDTKGSGSVDFTTNANNASSFRVFLQDSPANYLQVRGASTTIVPSLSAQGTDTNISMVFQPKGTGAIDLATGSLGVNISNGNTVTAVTQTGVGAGYTSIPSIAISAPTTAGGTTATATVTSMGINFVTVVSGGTGYAVNDEILISGGTFTTQARYRITAVSGGVVTTLTPIVTPNYQALPTNPASTTTAIGTGSGLTLTVNWAVTGYSFTAGSGYIEQPTVTFSGGGGSSQATAYATVGSDPILKSLTTNMRFLTSQGEAVRITGGGQTLTDYVELSGGVSGVTNGVYVKANGSSTNQSLYLMAKGTSNVGLYTNWSTAGALQFQASHTASAVNWVQVTGSVTTGSPLISAQGSDANPHLHLSGKGSGGVKAQTYFQVGFNYANYLSLSGSNANQPLTTSALGTDTNIPLLFQSKGTGAIDLSVGSSGVNISNGNTVTTITRTVTGSGYSTMPTVSIAAPTTAGGVQATVGTINMFSSGVTIVNGGTGYTVGNVLTVVGGTPTIATQLTVTTVSSGVITGVSIVANTGGYTALPTNPASVTGGTGTSATFNFTYGLNSLTILTAGSGYIEQPTVTISGGGGSGAAANVTVGNAPTLRSISSALSIFTPSGEAFRVSDNAAGSATGYWQCFGATTSPQLRAQGSGSGIVGTGSATPVQFITNMNATFSEQFRVSHVNNAVNYLGAQGAATTQTPGIVAFGTDTNVAVSISSKGGSPVQLITNSFASLQFAAAHTASAVNYVQVTGASTTNAPALSVQGSDTNIGLVVSAKGNGAITLRNNNSANIQFRADGLVSAVNYLQVAGSLTTNAPILSSQGADTNISMVLQSKGTGAINLATGSTGINISNGTTVTGITRTATGSGYTTPPTWTASAPTTAFGVTASGSVNNIILVSATIAGGGAGYTVGDTLTIVGGTFTVAATLTVLAVSAGVITSVTSPQNGLYTVAPTTPVSVTGGTGSSATFNVSFGISTSFTITTAGSGYVESPTVTFSGGGGSGAAAFASVGSAPIVKGLGGTQLNFATAGGTNFAVSDSGLLAPATYAFATGGSGSAGFGIISSNANAGFTFTSKGTSAVDFYTNGYGSLGLRVAHTASAVNYVQVTGSVTGGQPTISAQGSDTNVILNIASKNAAPILFFANGGEQFRAAGSASVVNSLSFSGGTSGLGPSVTARGSDTNVNLVLSTKGTGSLLFYTNNGANIQFQVLDRVSSVNYCATRGGVAGSPPTLSVVGSDTNIDLELVPKGTGRVKYGTHTATADAPITGYIEIVDSGGTIRKLAVIT